MAPLLAFGHASEFVMAHLSVMADGVVELQMVADYADNPMLPDEAAAAAALRGLLDVHADGARAKLEDLAALTFEKADQWPADTPASVAPPAGTGTHQLLIATWRWRPQGRRIVFEVPAGSRQDVLMWTHGTERGSAAARWLMLIAGDQTPPIEVPERPRGWWLLLGLVLLAIMAALQVRRGKRRARRMAGRP